MGGSTESFDYVDSLTIQISILKETSPGYFVEIWTDSVTDYDEIEVGYTNTRVNVASGYRYMVEAVHTVTHNGITETNSSDTNPVYVYYP